MNSELEKLKSLVRVYLVEDFNHDARACTEKGCEACDSVSRKREEIERVCTIMPAKWRE